MTMMKPSASLESWREFFRRKDSDIFEIIDHAIMVAATDYSSKFKSRRDKIAELLFSSRVSRCIGCDHHELSVPGDDRGIAGNGVGDGGDTEADGDHDDDEVGGSKESNANSSSRRDNNHGDDEMNLINNHQIVSHYTFEEEAKALSAAIEEFNSISNEVFRIKEILLNKDETNSVLLECLRKLKFMSLDVDVLKTTEIGKAVNGLRKHGSNKIRKLAKSLIAEWKDQVNQWMKTTAEIAGAEATPESANLSVVDEGEEAFPLLPFDVDFLTSEPNALEISQFLDTLDFDGNFCNPGEYDISLEDERRPQNVVKRRTEGREMRTQEAPFKEPSSANDFDASRRPLKPNNTEHKMKNEMVSVHKTDKPMIPKKPLVAEEKWKAPGPQQEKLKGLDSDAKFESAKRKLQESYQHHENAKKQRTIQVLEMIPKKGSGQKPPLKRPGMSNRRWTNGRT